MCDSSPLASVVGAAQIRPSVPPSAYRREPMTADTMMRTRSPYPLRKDLVPVATVCNGPHMAVSLLVGVQR
jgi:hypothetical protein